MGRLISREEFEAMAEESIAAATARLAELDQDLVAMFDAKVAAGELSATNANNIKAQIRQELDSALEQFCESLAEAANRIFSPGYRPEADND